MLTKFRDHSLNALLQDEGASADAATGGGAGIYPQTRLNSTRDAISTPATTLPRTSTRSPAARPAAITILRTPRAGIHLLVADAEIRH